MIDSHSFNAPQPGPHILFFGAIHGNEAAGAQALQDLIIALNTGQTQLLKGHLTIIPVCNPLAFEKNKRFVDVNLNRIFHMHKQANLYEEHLANTLIPFVEACDYLIDFHTVTAQSPPFAFLDHATDENLALIRHAQMSHTITGWPQLYTDHDTSTQDCAHQIGKSAATIECGQHADPLSTENARIFIKNILHGFGMIACDTVFPLQSQMTLYQMECMISKTKGLTFTQNFANFQMIQKGDVLAKSDFETITAPFDGAIIMPNPYAEIGSEMFYLATIKD